MKRLLFTSGLLLITLFTFSQNGIYHTYDDYKNNKLEGLDKIKYNDRTGASAHIEYEINGQKKKLKCKDFWGFMYEGHLFRNDNEYGGLAYLVISKGDFVYYESGGANTRAIDNKKKGITEEIKIRRIGYSEPISLDLNSKFISTKRVWSQLKKFTKNNPKFIEFKNCLKAAGIDSNMREDCIRKHINETKNFFPWENIVFYDTISRN